MNKKYVVTFDDDVFPSVINRFRLEVEEMGGSWEELLKVVCPDETDSDEKDSDDSLLDDILGNMYAADGDTEEMVVKSSMEVAYEIEEMVGASVAEVAKWLRKNGFSTKVVDDTVCWILYDKNVSY